jgi:hypothetical protein
MTTLAGYVHSREPVKLDCGHESTPDECSAGMATDRVTGKTLCFACAAEVIRGIMRQEGKIGGLYLSRKTVSFSREPSKDSWSAGVEVTTWDGTTLSDNVYVLNYWKNNFGDYRVAFRFMFDGEVWSGSGGGYGQLCHARRTKLKKLHP